MKRCILLLTVFFNLSAIAAVHEVTIVGNTFSPANIVIEVGDTVRWTNNGGFHNVEATDLFRCSDSCQMNSNSDGAPSTTWTTAEVTFYSATEVGMPINYFCAIHQGGGMVGTITVVEPPSKNVHIVRALGNLTFDPADITIAPGDSINFINDSGFHNVNADDDSFICSEGCAGDNSNLSNDISNADWNFFIKFEELGDNPYFCVAHGGANGIGMSGIIRVVDPGIIFKNGFE